MSRPRPMDWVARGATYGNDSVPYIVGPLLVNGDYIRFTHGLTAHADLTDFQDSSYNMFPQLEQTAVRVVGSISYWWGSFPASTPPNGRCIFTAHFRIGVASQTIGLYTPVEEPTDEYDMRTPECANDDFLWEYKAHAPFDSNFWNPATNVHDWRSPTRIPIDIRVKRRLKQREMLVLYGAYSCTSIVESNGMTAFQPPTDGPVLVYEPILRTLVRTIT